jgi:hypothetical protein
MPCHIRATMRDPVGWVEQKKRVLHALFLLYPSTPRGVTMGFGKTRKERTRHSASSDARERADVPLPILRLTHRHHPTPCRQHSPIEHHASELAAQRSQDGECAEMPRQNHDADVAGMEDAQTEIHQRG